MAEPRITPTLGLDVAGSSPSQGSAGAEPGPVIRAIHERRSVGVVQSAPVPRDVIETLLAAAVRAPNHKQTEPWRFVVLQGPARRALGQAHARAVARESGGSEVSERDVAKLERAPVLIACCCASEPSDPVQAREDRDAVAAGVQNLLLAAEALGLAAMWRTGTMPYEPEVRAYLGLTDKDEIVAFVYLGWPRPGARPQAPTRRPLSELVDWRSG